MVSIAERVSSRLGPLNILRSRLEGKEARRQARYEVTRRYVRLGLFEVMERAKEELLSKGLEAELFWTLISDYRYQNKRDPYYVVEARSEEPVPDRIPDREIKSPHLVLELANLSTRSSVFVYADRRASFMARRWPLNNGDRRLITLEIPYDPNDQNWRSYIKEAITLGIHKQQFPDPEEFGFTHIGPGIYGEDSYYLRLEDQYPDRFTEDGIFILKEDI